jgi:hypothetical protein
MYGGRSFRQVGIETGAWLKPGTYISVSAPAGTEAAEEIQYTTAGRKLPVGPDSVCAGEPRAWVFVELTLWRMK